MSAASLCSARLTQPLNPLPPRTIHWHAGTRVPGHGFPPSRLRTQTGRLTHMPLRKRPAVLNGKGPLARGGSGAGGVMQRTIYSPSLSFLGLFVLKLFTHFLVYKVRCGHLSVFVE